MKPEHIEHVLELYKNRQDVEKEAHLADFDEIKANDFNLNIPRYVDSNEDEIPVDLSEVNADLANLNSEIETTKAATISMLSKLSTDDESTLSAVNDFIKLMEGI